MKKIATSLLFGSLGLGSLGLALQVSADSVEASDISEIQQLLKQQGYEIKAVNGVFDASTQHALMMFQLDNNLPADAQLNDQTLSVLLKRAVVAQVKDAAKPELTDEGRVIEIALDASPSFASEAQRQAVTKQLRQRGYEAANLRDAIISFQVDNDLSATGLLDEQTLDALGVESLAAETADVQPLQAVEVPVSLALPAFPGQAGAKIVGDTSHVVSVSERRAAEAQEMAAAEQTAEAEPIAIEVGEVSETIREAETQVASEEAELQTGGVDQATDESIAPAVKEVAKIEAVAEASEKIDEPVVAKEVAIEPEPEAEVTVAEVKAPAKPAAKKAAKPAVNAAAKPIRPKPQAPDVDLIAVSERLADLGYDTAKLDEAVKLFQLDSGIPAEGQFDTATMNALFAKQEQASPKGVETEPKEPVVEAPEVAQPVAAALNEAGLESDVSAQALPATNEPGSLQPTVQLATDEDYLVRLRDLGYQVDSDKEALILFQLDNDIVAEGYLDDSTKQAIATASPLAEPILQPRNAEVDEDVVVQQAQEVEGVDLDAVDARLTALGYDVTNRVAALKLYQLDNDLAAEGQLDAKTVTLLLGKPGSASPDPIVTDAGNQPSATPLNSGTDYMARLRELGYQVDSDKEAVILFQLDNDIVAEGYLDDATKQAIATAQPLAEPILQPRNAEVDEDIIVQQAQEVENVDLDEVDAKLTELGYDASNRTAALKLYQLDNDLVAEGQLDAKTVALLLGKPEQVVADSRYQVPADPAAEDVLERLALHGYPVSEAAEGWDESNQIALKLFQLDHDIPAEAQLDEATLTALFTKIIPEAPAEELPSAAQNEQQEAPQVEEQQAQQEEVAQAVEELAGPQDQDPAEQNLESAQASQTFEKLPPVQSNEVAEIAAALGVESTSANQEAAPTVEGVVEPEAPAPEAATSELAASDAVAVAEESPPPEVEEAQEALPVEAPVVADEPVNGEEVNKAEQRLVELQYLNADSANGRWTAWDRRALTFFQLENMLAPSGELDAETETALFSASALPDPQRAGAQSHDAASSALLAVSNAQQNDEVTPATGDTQADKNTVEEAVEPVKQETSPMAEAVAADPASPKDSVIQTPAVEAVEPAETAEKQVALDTSSDFLTAPADTGATGDASALAAINAAAKPSTAAAKQEKVQKLETSSATRPATVAEANKPVPNVKPAQEKVIEPPKELKPDIELVQKRLQKAGFYDGEIDGLKGPKLTRATKYFQLINNIPATGKLDQTTLKLLYRQEPFTRR